ncbi:hypothetical protein CDD83_2454 [Cordyceps sp. RAO-2017]|nr:hypothetical protein CDD83_2454 [Cordyceps sp. RAO-2017]
MFRAARPLLRLTARTSANPLPLRTCSPVLRRPGAPWRPVLATPSLAARSSATAPPPKQPIDHEHEKQVAQQSIEARPGEVSSQSSVRHVMEGSSSSARDDPSLSRGVKHDIEVFRDTFRLSAVPRESHILGLAGTLPYLATSLSTIFLAWDLTKQLPTGNALYDAVFIDHQTARHLLGVIEPLQLGYGAVIISFLGAIHWGLEYAEKKPSPKRTRFRYGVGLAASAVAWPTLYMPLEYALTTQFMAFVALYFVDSRCASRGLAPPWYGTYRFLLTAMVGFAILLSLVARAKISTHGRLSSQGLSSSMANPGIADNETDWAKLEAEDMAQARREKAEAEKKKKEEERKKKSGDGKKADGDKK